MNEENKPPIINKKNADNYLLNKFRSIDKTAVFVITVCLMLLFGYYTKTIKQSQVAESTTAKSESSSSSKIEVNTPGKTIFLDANKWFPMSNTQDWAKNYQSKEKKEWQEFNTVLTIFLQPMTSERKKGKKVTSDEYVEIFPTLPGTVTVQLRVDKDKYWVLTRDTYKVITPNSMQVERDPVVYNSIYNEIQTYIDTSRFFIRNEL